MTSDTPIATGALATGALVSESARMTTAKEAAFRIPYPNSRPRAAKIIALDAVSAAIVDTIAKSQWNGAAFFSSLSFESGKAPGGTAEGVEAWLNDLAGRAMDLYTEIAGADFVVVITAAGEDARAVTVIADACRAHNKTLVGLIVPQQGAGDSHVAVSLDHLRPHTRMLVVASGTDYVEAMLTALRA